MTQTQTLPELVNADSGTVIYGHSDDLIEFEGEITGEIGCFNERVLVAISDGTLLRWEYTEDGLWKVDVLLEGSCFGCVENIEYPSDEDYSDIVHMKTGCTFAWWGIGGDGVY